MKESCLVYQVDAFTRTRFSGNPAGVVPHADGLGDAQMQAIARELNNSETAFILRARGGDHDVHVRFFTPTTEVPVCGHATIAAHYVRAVEGHQVERASVRQLTGAGVMGIDVEPVEDGDVRIWMHQRAPEFGPVLSGRDRAQLIAALGIGQGDLGDGPIEIVSTGHSKVMIPLRDRALLDGLKPDLPTLVAISKAIGCNGFHTFTLDDPAPGMLAHARMFAPAIGIAEDPVTGNANGPLGAYLVQHRLVPLALMRAGLSCWMGQGEAMGRPGRVRVEVAVDPVSLAPRAVRIGGDAVIAFRAEIPLDATSHAATGRSG